VNPLTSAIHWNDLTRPAMEQLLWSTIAADLVATLRLPIDASTVAAIAASTVPIGDKLETDSVGPGAQRSTTCGLTGAETDVLGQHLTMDVDADGCRTVIGQPLQGEKTLAVYGCSFTSVSEPASSDTEKKPLALFASGAPFCDNVPAGTVTRRNLPLGK
jgi:hypothetical protein